MYSLECNAELHGDKIELFVPKNVAQTPYKIIQVEKKKSSNEKKVNKYWGGTLLFYSTASFFFIVFQWHYKPLHRLVLN